MAGVSDEWIQQQEKGFVSSGDKHVCSDCFDDYAISQYIEDVEDKGNCSYCGTKGVIVAPIDYVIEFVLEGILSEYGDPSDEGIAYESREGGWQYQVYVTYELLYEKGFLEVDQQELFDDIANSMIDRQWVERDPYLLSEQETLIYGWGGFTYLVKHNTRYVFFRTPGVLEGNRPDEIEPVDILDQIGRISHELDLVQILPSGTDIIRIRVTETTNTYGTATELGTPPVEDAKYSNRMSPAGIPMFYGAFDKDTAVSETFESRPGYEQKIITGNFQLQNDIYVLDLTKISEVPSIFDSSNRHLRSAIVFLQEFVRDLSKTIKKDGREHIEYVPTQVVTEYFRHLFHLLEDSGRERLHGIIYPSARNNGGKACVLFVSNEQCLDEDSAASEVDLPCLMLSNVEEVIVSD